MDQRTPLQSSLHPNVYCQDQYCHHCNLDTLIPRKQFYKFHLTEAEAKEIIKMNPNWNARVKIRKLALTTAQQY